MSKRSIFVISDLHLGGAYPVPPEKRGFRLCTRADAIVQFVEQRTKEMSKCGHREIVLNGDTVDFLAERDSSCVGGVQTESWSSFTAEPNAAVAKFKTIACRDKAVFESFGRFLDAGGRLTMLLGNHDVELSLPSVRAALRTALGVKPAHDFEFLYDNEAYVVGDAIIEHGNRYDSWNQVDHDALRRVRSLQSRHLPISGEYAFVPPAGSEMVTSVINTIKKDYAFVDLLKPETGAVVPILLALEPGYRSLIARIALLHRETRSHGLATAANPQYGGDIRSEDDVGAVRGGDIGAAGRGEYGDETLVEISASRPKEDLALRQTLQTVLGGEAEDFLRDLEAQMADIDPLGQFGGQISVADSASRIFGFAALVFGRTSQSYEKRLPALLRAMRGLNNADTFDPRKEGAKEYLDAAQALADHGAFRYVLFGHTHLAKQVSLGEGRVYFNSGTWADVLRFPAEILSQDGASNFLKAFVAQMKSGDFSRWAIFCPTYIRLDVGEDGKVANARLERFTDAAA